jgi:hypothetical protein
VSLPNDSRKLLLLNAEGSQIGQFTTTRSFHHAPVAIANSGEYLLLPDESGKRNFVLVDKNGDKIQRFYFHELPAHLGFSEDETLIFYQTKDRNLRSVPIHSFLWKNESIARAE